ncbi:RNA-2',3'-PO4:RNA-5'-OH ligase [Candidatus Syntrophocurvum alkaliphilum]|uniref:3'-phosphate/5'-hydroxy nucleic acid ligase n=1 Tax=Candidatus Syntrophocurvum alkaliphilum TaxID=2293317 RepID=A0A6I6DBB4_9FIRM|nr:RtcB family protein [Candidatus Syntrophocurvum alkaliphilum]QGT99599.1 RNA-2',3'-PO4:RNA-5'-OH ligase [Candidatus Syntrophocurvum alkaliphilum]
MKTFNIGSIPIKSWTSNIEEGAMQQAINLSKHPFAYKHIAIMPDVHEGYGMPIGGVLATKDVIIPNAVGVDIGCGVIALQTDKKTITQHEVKNLIETCRKFIPLGFKHHKKPQLWDGFDNAPNLPIINQEITSAKKQIGTLGGGNHFIECQKGDDGYIWLMVHSGSRNIGLKVAKYYNDAAKELNRKINSSIPKEYDLAYLPLNTELGNDYYNAMNFCLEFARANRTKIAYKVFEIFIDIVGPVKIQQKIDIQHNYAAVEEHFNSQLIIHRKGATSAKKGQLGIIPGSMGTASYIVKGLGNTESFMSCSHGAGRVMSRKKANKCITEEMANEVMKGIYFGSWKNDYSEAPLAYKNIEDVLKQQTELVKKLVKLKPLGVLKG